MPIRKNLVTEKPSYIQHEAGFTLLELSIVLVIIGLLIGGIFVGQSLIKNAQLNAVVSEYGRYQAATQAFKEQYRALPGDMPNASSFWGAADGSTGSTAGCQSAAGTGTQTCNGDGDGTISSSTASLENFRYWQHLSLAKIIEGSYAGILEPTWQFVLGYNYPISKYAPNVGWAVAKSPVASAGTCTSWLGGPLSMFSTDYGSGHVFTLGTPISCGLGTLVYGSTAGGALLPKDAWALDKKIDDGMPGLGNVISTYNNSCTSAGSGNTDMTNTYTLTTTTAKCALFFITNF